MKIIAKYTVVVLSIFITFIQTNAQPNMTSEQAITNSKTVTQGSNLFANELLENYVNAKDSKDKNIFFSPISIVSVLAMAGEGAKGQTAMEIQRVLHQPTFGNNTQVGFNGLLSSLKTDETDYKLLMANALWVQKDYTLLKDFLYNVQTNYKSEAKNVDFKLQPEAARQTINNWVETNTNKKIKNLLSKGDITDKTRLILTNTIYFNGTWQNEFAATATAPADFTTSGVNTIKVQMMHLQKNFVYHDVENAQILEMPYKNNELSMVIILPKNGFDIKTLATATTLATLYNNDDNGNALVNVSFPKFKFETKSDMNAYLEKMGMSTAFGKGADFSGITGKKDLSISKIVHQAYIDVKETGTEAAAATGGIMRAGAAIQRPKVPVIFNADHPFIFAIRHNATGAMLFMGVVNNPNQQ